MDTSAWVESLTLTQTASCKVCNEIAQNDDSQKLQKNCQKRQFGKNDLQGMTIYNLAKGVQIDMNYGWIMQGHHELSGAISH